MNQWPCPDLFRFDVFYYVECLHHFVQDDCNGVIEKWLSKHDKVKYIIDTDLLKDRQNLEDERRHNQSLTQALVITPWY